MSRLDEALRAREQDERRLNDARLFAAKIKSRENLLTLIAELTERYESDQATPAARPMPPIANDATIGEVPKGELAEAIVLRSDRGMAPSVVGARIGTRGRGADQVLREVARTRKTVVRSRGKWYPAGKVPDSALTLGMVIKKVMADGDVLSTAEVYERVEQLAPGTKKTSVAVEITRLVDDGTLAVQGQSPHSKGYLYALKKGGAPAAAAR